jgi:hypothetical protein
MVNERRCKDAKMTAKAQLSALIKQHTRRDAEMQGSVDRSRRNLMSVQG